MNFDDYFMTLCFIVCQKSKDTTKHGSIIATPDNKLISCGYNGNNMGIDDSLVPASRPEKYKYVIHSEANSILMAEGRTKGNKIYISGICCSQCLKIIIQSGISEIIYGPIKSDMIENDTAEKQAINNLIKWSGIKIRQYTATQNIFSCLSNAAEYLKSKI